MDRLTFAFGLLALVLASAVAIVAVLYSKQPGDSTALIGMAGTMVGGAFALLVPGARKAAPVPAAGDGG